MPGLFQRTMAAFRPRRAPQALGGFVDSLIQSFENCRDGLTDEAIRAGRAEPYFRARYEPERDRLADVLRLNPLLGDEARADLFERVDRLIGDVLIPAYVRLAVRYTKGERNDFYHSEPRLHGLERVGFALAGAVVGAFAVWAPFIPLWEKEWVLPFFVAGLLYPELRRTYRVRRYERELNRLVSRTDAEIDRIDESYLLHPSPEGRDRIPAAEPPTTAGPPGGPERTKPAADIGEGNEKWSRSQGSKRQRER
jgi:hypothetical protein